MNNVAKINHATEDEPKGVLVIPWPENCYECRLRGLDDETDEPVCCAYDLPIRPYYARETKPDWCDLFPAIGIIESNGHVVYLQEKTDPRPCVSNEWISVEEELPEEYLGVLINCPTFKNIYLAYLDKGQWYIFGGHSQMIVVPVTHWRYLPKPPEVR